jgi:alanine racemase
MESLPFRSWVEVSRGQIAENFRAVRGIVGSDVEIAPVVKADAYRHGAVEVSRVLTGQGARWLCVSNVDEGCTIRESGINARILVMADFLPSERKALLEFQLTPVIHSLADIAELNRLASAREQPVSYHLKVDSGMGRLGTRAAASEIAEAILANRWARLEGVMTHFASAADYTSPQTSDQVARFRSVCEGLAATGIRYEFVHLSSTIPVAYCRQEAWGTMVRPGHAIYGYVSPPRGGAPARALNVKPALTWKAAILAVKDIPQGALVGYGGMYRAARPMRIAVLAAGYADGIPHRLSNRGRVIAGGKLAPIIGAVSMDLTTVDITHSPELQPGDAVTLLGSEGGLSIDAQQIARTAGTISYSVLCGIHARVKRIYV